MIYHFKISKERSGMWANCIELPGCSTQGESWDEIRRNAFAALNLYLDEPENSKIIFPLPKSKIKPGRNIIEVAVEPGIAFSFLMRRERIKRGLTQHQMKSLLQFKSLFSYQKLEISKYANPTLKSLKKIKDLLPGFPLKLLL